MFLAYYPVAQLDSYVDLSKMIGYATMTPAQQEQFVGANLAHSIRLLPLVLLVSSRLPAHSNEYFRLKHIGQKRTGLTFSTPGELLEALQTNLSKDAKAVRFLCKTYKGTELLQLLERPDSVSISSKENEGGDGDDTGRVRGKINLSSSAVAAIRNDENILALHAMFKQMESAGGVSDKDRKKIFEKICTFEGMLPVVQMLYKHDSMRSAHEVINSLYFLRRHLAEWAGRCVNLNLEGKPRGYSKGSKLEANFLALFLAAKHVDMETYKHGTLVARAAEIGTDQIDPENSDFEWVVNNDEFARHKDFLHRLTIALFYAKKPKKGKGSPVSRLFKYLQLYRETIALVAAEEQLVMYNQISEWWSAAMEESSEFLSIQLDEVEPAGKRLEGFLPPSSTSSGVIFHIREALEAQTKVNDMRRRAPHFFHAQHKIVISPGRNAWDVVAGKRVLEADDDATPAKKKAATGDGVPAIGSVGHKVKWLSADYFRIGNKVYGPLSTLAEEVGMRVADRCWPVVLSTKPYAKRAEICPSKTKTGHDQATKGKHKPVDLPADYKDRFIHEAQGFTLPE